MKNYYDMLALGADAPGDEIKKAFRREIARYHPDKVQHLGKEFQDMAADRAAELTEAYRILSDAGRRAEYDHALSVAPPAPHAQSETAAPPPPPVEHPSESPKRDAGREPSRPPGETPGPGEPDNRTFKEERQVRDEYMRKATLSRFRTAVSA